MDPSVWILLAGVVAVILVVAIFIQRRFSNTEKKRDGERDPAGVVGRGRAAVVAGGARRPQARNVRARVAALQRARGEGPREWEEEGSEGEDEMDEYVEELVEEMVGREERKGTAKIGTKKLRRIQEKAERKAMREQEEAMREDRKKREALREKERKREEKEEQAKLKREEEEERLKKEEEERKEEEEYQKLKESFLVEEEGVDAKDDEAEARGVRDFINYIKSVKVVYMEDLAAEFGLKTQDAISRVQSLQESGELSGVVDDRGKFIYISEEELQAVAQFIKQRGRVSIAELVSSSNRLINLQPESLTTPT